MRSLMFGLLFLAPFVVGCGTGQGKMSGRVLYNGNPLPGGTLLFRPVDPKHNPVNVELDEQGNYEATLPAGEVQVSVDNRWLEPRAPQSSGGLPLNLPLSAEARKTLGSAKPDKTPPKPDEDAPEKNHGKYVRIPDKYYDIEKSGLRFKVQGGNQKQDIELKAGP